MNISTFRLYTRFYSSLGPIAATCSVTIKKTGEQIDLGLFSVNVLFLPFSSDFITGNLWEPLSGYDYQHFEAVL